MAHPTPRILVAAGLLAGCIDAGDDPVATYTASVTGDPALEMVDSFVPFQPGLFGYDLTGGTTSHHRVYQNFGVTNPQVFPDHDITPHGDAPDHKQRVRIKVTGNLGNVSGDIIVHGTVYERDWEDPLQTPSSFATQEQLNFAVNGTKTTSVYFDELTLIETPNLSGDATLEVDWWNGHEQEMLVAVTISNIADEATCEDGWRVYFNSQTALPDWDPTTARCTAGLYPGMIKSDGLPQTNGAYRGLYFGLELDEDASDAFHHFVNPTTHDPTVPYGHTSVTRSWLIWWAALPLGKSLFVPLPETHIRPIVVELERQSDLHVVDAARVLMTISRDAYGNPGLVARLAAVDNAGAIAQLSPRGLDRLEATHAATLPYPIVPAGTQPRLSDRAIDLPWHATGTVEVDIRDLPEDDKAYWTEENPDEDEQFAGYEAYEDIHDAAVGSWGAFRVAMNLCKLVPQTQVACENLARTNHCVQHDPGPNDFRIRIEGIDTYFDPQRPDDALVIGDVTHMDLAFGVNQVLSDYTVEDIQGWLQASIPLERIFIEWDKPPLDLCFVKPDARPLSDFADGTDDYREWLTCRDLSFTAGSGTLGAPIPFDIDPDGEELLTLFAEDVAPVVSLPSIGADPGPDICGDDWLADTIVEAIEGWKTAVETTIGIELATSPGQDEALDRLLSPYELGIEHVDDPPPETPEYDVHPLATYDLSAVVTKTTADTRFPGADATDGLYVPYLTRSSPVGSIPYINWFCIQSCDGLQGLHPDLLAGGLDPDGDPFDVSITYTTAHINQALWAQARRPDRLGSPNDPARLPITTTAVVDFATTQGFADVAAALAPLGSSFGIRFHHQGAPYTSITDNLGLIPPRMVYVIPNIVVELVSIAGDGTETVVAKLLVDVVDRDHQVAFSTGGVPELTASWGQVEVLSMTSTFLPGCDGARTGTSCNTHLLTVIGALWWPLVQNKLLDLIEQAPGLHRFDAGQESGKPRHLENVRTFLQGALVLTGDLCKPGTVGCT